MQIKYFYFILFSLLTSFTSIANDFDKYEDNNGMPPNDNPPLAPIDDWVPFLLMIAILFAFYSIRNKNRVTN